MEHHLELKYKAYYETETLYQEIEWQVRGVQTRNENGRWKLVLPKGQRQVCAMWKT